MMDDGCRSMRCGKRATTIAARVAVSRRGRPCRACMRAPFPALPPVVDVDSRLRRVRACMHLVCRKESARSTVPCGCLRSESRSPLRSCRPRGPIPAAAQRIPSCRGRALRVWGGRKLREEGGYGRRATQSGGVGGSVSRWPVGRGGSSRESGDDLSRPVRGRGLCRVGPGLV